MSAQERMAAFAQELLESYFTFRRPLPEAGCFQENKSTQQIQDELLPMYVVSAESIVAYMTPAGYGLTTEGDGTVAWAIWRMI